jgi:hypothetical protein
MGEKMFYPLLYNAVYLGPLKKDAVVAQMVRAHDS